MSRVDRFREQALTADDGEFRWCGPRHCAGLPSCPRCDGTCEGRQYRHAHQSQTLTHWNGLPSPTAAPPP